MNGNIYSQKNMSQEDIILLHLIKHGKISNKECNKEYGFTHLPSVIRYLRKKNIKIVNNPHYGKNRFGTNVYWVDYVLAPNKEQSPKVISMIERFKDLQVVGG
ncbi:MAG: hypothetical protein E7Z92_03680 [Cyanobacteria bacterium SIG31]|nr:hypothetical protein [Cyanobacteria bacterium SIG31]